MAKIHRPTRLIAYDTDENIKRRARGEAKVYRLVRPRTILYAVVIALAGGIMLYKLTTRTNSHLSVLHVRAPLFTQTAEGGVRNGYTLRFANKWSEPGDFTLEVSGLPGATLNSEMAKPARRAAQGPLDPDSTLEVPVYVTAPPDLRRASRRRSPSPRPTRRPGSATSWSITSSAHDFLAGDERRSETFELVRRTTGAIRTADRTARPRHFGRVLLRDVRGERRADLFRPAHAARVELENPYDASQAYQPADRRGPRPGRAGMDRQRDDPGGRAGGAGHGRVPRSDRRADLRP